MPARGGGFDPDVVLAPAKLTRSLRIVGVRDDGFHLLEAEMVTVSLCDRLEISDGDGLSVVDDVEWYGERGAPVLEAATARGGSDLVERALAAVGRKARVSLTKRIPAGAGLGGGSADAAAVLRWAGCTDALVASRIGADVPFCLSGGRASVGGIGERLEPLPFEFRRLVVVVPAIHVPTPAVYAAWDSLGGPTGEHGNDLEPAALALAPRLVYWRDLVAGVAGQRPSLAGSGGAWWLDVEGDSSRAIRLVGELKGALDEAGERALVKSVETVE